MEDPQNLKQVFEEELVGPPAPAPSVPSEWVEGKHKFFLVEDKNSEGETALSKALDEKRAAGMKVIDFQRFGNYWVIKTMAPRE